MKNFQGLHKCATGAVINTEDFMKSNKSNTGSMLTGVNNAATSIGDRNDRKRKRDVNKRQRQRNRQQGSKPNRSCRNNYIGN